MKRKADSYIADIGKRATIKTTQGDLRGRIAIRFGRLCIEESAQLTDRYAVIHDDSEIEVEEFTP